MAEWSIATDCKSVAARLRGFESLPLDMTIYFVCEGNTFRSRLAEAYLKSKNIDDVTVKSSGTRADHNQNGPITWYAQRILKKHGLLAHSSPTWTQATKEELEKADRVIFIGHQNYDRAVNDIGAKPKDHEVWRIKDLWEFGFTDDMQGYEDELARIKATDQVFEEIKEKVDALMRSQRA